MKLTNEGKETIEKLRLITGTTFEQCKDFFESLTCLIILNYLEENETCIPFFGSIKPFLIKDTITSEGKIAEVGINFNADHNLKKIVGQIIDGEETEIEKSFLLKIKTELENKALES